jgi:hypothetical protein
MDVEINMEIPPFLEIKQALPIKHYNRSSRRVPTA